MQTSDIITLIFSGIVAISTVIYVVYTIRLTKETRLSREFFLESHIIVYLTIQETNTQMIDLKIKNIGKGVARDVKLTLTSVFNDEFGMGFPNKSGLFSTGMTFFPPEYEITYLLASIKQNENRELKIRVDYYDALNKDRSYIINLKLSEAEGVGKMTPPRTYEGLISHELSKLNNTLKLKK